MGMRCCFLFLAAALVAAPLRAAEAAAPAAPPRHFLWSVDHPDHAGRVHLLGSLHLCRPDMYPLPLEIETAYAESQVVAFEVKLDARTQAEIATLFVQEGLNPHGLSLTSQLQPETRTLLTAHLQANGLDLAPLERQRPWYLAVSLTIQELRKLGLNPDLGLDMHFFRRAERDLKVVRGLETPAEQLRLLGGLDAGTSDLMLRQALRDAGDLPADIEATLVAWKQGDTAALDAVLMKDFRSPEFLPLWNRLLVERNLHFARRVEDFLAAGEKAFVVVGAGHLVGPQSVPDLLTRRGYRVRQH
jgi:uncharacterized protein YbaP (TraB family)